MCATSKELLAVVVQDSHRVKAGLLQLNSTIPFVDNDAYVVSSDVSLAGYICTHVCLFYVFCRETSVSLVVSRGLRRLACYLSYDLVPRQDLIDSQASQPFSFIDVCTQT